MSFFECLRRSGLQCSWAKTITSNVGELKLHLHLCIRLYEVVTGSKQISVYNWLNFISSPAAMLNNYTNHKLVHSVDRWKVQDIIFEPSKLFSDRGIAV